MSTEHAKTEWNIFSEFQIFGICLTSPIIIMPSFIAIHPLLIYWDDLVTVISVEHHILEEKVSEISYPPCE